MEIIRTFTSIIQEATMAEYNEIISKIVYNDDGSHRGNADSKK